MLDLITLVALFILFTVEFVLNLLAHALALRFAMCHTLVLLIFNVASACTILAKKKRTTSMTFLRTKVDVDTFVTFLFGVSFVLVFGFVVVNSLHSLQLLVHRHDMDVHYGLVVLLVGAADFLLKLFLTPVLDCGFYDKSNRGRVQKILFYLTASILLLAIASLRCVSSSYQFLVLWLDPALTIVGCATVCIAAFNPAKEFLYTLLLAAPRDLDVSEVSGLLRREFPEADIHELRIWRESRSRTVASIHIRMQQGERYLLLARQVHAFFHNLGINRAIIQPEFEEPGVDKCVLPCPCRRDSTFASVSATD